MPKLLWVLAPLAVVAAWLLILAARRRLPSRPSLNVLFSLLLLVYLAGTAGLGIFWVANQQLPVFDWHYLFGYATVLLLVVHLGFNLRIVGMHLRRMWSRTARPRHRPGHGAAGSIRLPERADGEASRRAGSVPADVTLPRLARRPVLGVAGAGALALAGGLGYLLGLRHGRVELNLGGEIAGAGATSPPRASANTAGPSPAAAGPAAGGATTAPAGVPVPDPRAWAVVERFHAFSGHSRTRVLRHAASTDWGDGPPPFKRYPGSERVALPPPRRTTAGTPAATVHSADLGQLGTWLWHTAGVSETRGGLALRTAPSSGALFATELYVLAREVSGLAPGAWHYDAEHHALERMPSRRSQGTGAGPVAANSADPADTIDARLAACGPLALPAACPAVIVASAVFARSGRKYGDRTYRYVVADLGHALENLRLATHAAGGYGARLLPWFDDLAVAGALGLDARSEGALAVVALDGDVPVGGNSVGDTAGPGAMPQVERPRSGHDARPSHWTSALPGAGETDRLGLTEGIQAATSLRASAPTPADDGTAARRSPAGPALPAPPGPPALAPHAADARAGLHRLPPPRPLFDERRSPAVFQGQADPGASQGLPARGDPLALIAGRRSHRRFSTRALTQQALADVLGAMTGPAPLLSGAVRIDVLTAAVEGLEPAAWRVSTAGDAAAPVLQRRVVHGLALRRLARAAALDQDVIGDAAVVFVLSLDVSDLRADAAGPARGYRHGFLEAGLVGERIYLAAGALGLATCAVGAFYDDEAAALVGLDAQREWVVHFAGLGPAA